MLINWANGESWLLSAWSPVEEVEALLEVLPVVLLVKPAPWRAVLRMDCK